MTTEIVVVYLFYSFWARGVAAKKMAFFVDGPPIRGREGSAKRTPCSFGISETHTLPKYLKQNRRQREAALLGRRTESDA